MSRRANALYALPVVLVLAVTTTRFALAGQKKLVYYGWGIPDTAYAAAHWMEIERIPFDGTAISVAIDREAWRRGRTDTRNQLGWNVFGVRAFRLAEFSQAIDDLKKSRWTRFTDNFLPVVLSSQGQDHGFSWFDESRWKTIVNNWRMVLTLAREGGCHGIMLDPEHYGARFFSYPEMGRRVVRSFAEYQYAVQNRGREFGEAVRAIFPNSTTIGLFGYSLARATVKGSALAESEYGLYAAFLDGMLQAAPSAFRFVDGYEFAYAFKTEAEFQQARREITQAVISVSRVTSRYRKPVEVGFGLWLDYGGGQLWDSTDVSRNYFNPTEVREALTHALRLSDEYVWLYSQTPRFFPPRDLPGTYLEAISAAREAAQGS